MTTEIVHILKQFTGEILPTQGNLRDKRRMFIDEFNICEQEMLLNFLHSHKSLIVNDILKGRGQFAAEWVLVAQKVNANARWVLNPMNLVINHYGNDDIIFTKRGSVKIGRITMQRKGGDGGRNTAKMLQFKIDPTELFNI